MICCELRKPNKDNQKRKRSFQNLEHLKSLGKKKWEYQKKISWKTDIHSCVILEFKITREGSNWNMFLFYLHKLASLVFIEDGLCMIKEREMTEFCQQVLQIHLKSSKYVSKKSLFSSSDLYPLVSKIWLKTKKYPWMFLSVYSKE